MFCVNVVFINAPFCYMYIDVSFCLGFAVSFRMLKLIWRQVGDVKVLNNDDVDENLMLP